MTQVQPIATEPIHLRLPPTVQMDDDQFFAFCQANSDYRIERNAVGEIPIMPPTEIDGDDVVTGLRLNLRPIGQTVL